jgi:hypothetical protein
MTTHEAPPGNRQDLFNTLAFLTGHLEAASARDRYAVDALHDKLAQLLPRTDLATARNRYFSVESSDLFFADAVASQERARLVQLSDRIAADARPPDLRVFVRDVPVRTTQMRGSVPLWAGGAAVAETLGPFLNKDGRRVWFDFYKITRLVALYLQGRPDPAILFNVSLVKKFPHIGLPAVVDALAVYRLVPDSVWINAALLAPNAPANLFTGLKIKGGTVTLSAAPQLVNGKLTLAGNTKATVALDLDPAARVASDAASPYGNDARKAGMHLPETFTFHFTSGAAGIDVVDGRIDWTVYGQAAEFRWNKTVAPAFEPLLNRVLIPLDCSVNRFTVTDCVSPFMTLAGAADIERSAWALPVAQLDVAKPPPAAGIGGLAVHGKKGLTAQWQGLKGGAVNLTAPWLLSDPGRLNVTDLQAGNVFCTQEYRLWKDALNPYGTSVKLTYTAAFPFIFNTTADGNEAFLAFANANPLLDRPVTVTGLPFDIRSKNSALIVAANKAWKLIYLIDDNILFDNYDPKKPKATLPAPLAVALQNALFRVTPVNGFLLFGALADDMLRVEKGLVFLTLGMYGYVPTLPDPYAANLGVLRAQFERVAKYSSSGIAGQTVWLWLVAQTQWQPLSKDTDQVEVSFHFAPLQNQFAIAPAAAQEPGQTGQLPAASAPPAAVAGFGQHPFVQLFEAGPLVAAAQEGAVETAMMMAGAPAGRGRRQPPDYQGPWRDRFGFIDYDTFALLDVSSNANQMGVSFASLGASRVTMMRTHEAVPAEQSAGAADGFPLQVRGMDVVARSPLVRAFTTPVVSWEPVINLTPPEAGKFDPPAPLNYYPDDGGPTRIFNNSARLVPIAPIPVCDSLVDAYAKEPGNLTVASFTLPFGIRSLAYLYKTNVNQQDPKKEKPSIQFNAPEFDNDLKGGIQLKLSAGSGFHKDENNLFRGFTLQMNNVLDLNGQPTGTTTLGEDVAFIFNLDFFNPPTNMDNQSGVPVTRIDVSGYGASTFSNWVNEKAQFASTSQARFDVMVGRTAHEVVQVKSVVYPWGIHVVRTVTLFRVGSGYVYRFDSGWKAQSDGKFDFHFQYVPDPSDPDTEDTAAPYKIHPGTVRGLFNVQNIKTAIGDVLPFTDSMDITSFYELSPAFRKPMAYAGGASPVAVNLQPVYFDADVELENVVQGQVNGKVPAKKILGFVQLAPSGIPLTPDAFQRLLMRQFGSIGGPLACIMDIGNSGQKLRVNFIDVNASVNTNGTTPVFVAAARGHVVLPKDGSWSLVMHARGTGDVTPLPDSVSVPLIRVGELADDMTFPDTELLRIANPADLVRAPAADTLNFGFLQSTNTQKTLFLTPSFAGQATDTVPGKLLSKTPPLFVDAYRLMGSKAIFPNIGDAETSFGSAITLTKNFVSSALQDGGKNVLELMNISSADGVTRLKEDGYKLANQVKSFDLPTKPWYLIDEDYLKIYVEYEATPDGAAKRAGVLDFDVDSFAAAAEDRWKSRLNNMAMVVDLGPFPRLATIKGNFDAKKGSEAGYVGTPGDSSFPAPQLELSDALEKAKDILQLLAALQSDDYVEVFKRGLKIAMSNGPDSWEYKFEASQEIPALKFPPPIADSPNSPLKIEASLKLGVYFNAALTTAALSDPKKLLPTAGAFVEFYGRLSVMCVSVSLGTVYAVGQANLRIAGDTGIGPSLDMKFGFGAQLVVGLPVVGNVSVLYMVGVEIYVDSKTLAVSAFMMFQGHAELIGGLVSITITIEAKGTVTRQADQTTCAAQVTFAIDVSIFLVIDIHFSKSWGEQRQIA